jgi:hypothetical protein
MWLHFLWWSLLGFEGSMLGFRNLQVVGGRILHLFGFIGGVLTEHAPTKGDEAMKICGTEDTCSFHHRSASNAQSSPSSSSSLSNRAKIIR